MRVVRVRALGVVTVGAALLVGCASIVGIGDLPGSSSGGGSGGGSSGATSSSSGSASGSSSGTGVSSSSSGTGSSSSGGPVDLPVGSRCATTGECASGLACIGDVCRIPCTTIGSTCSSSGACESYDTGDACTVPCSPKPDSCKAGLACEVGELTGTSTVLSDCEIAGTVGPRGSCQNFYDCVAGYTCPSANGVFTCQAWCNYPTACAGGVTCEQYVEFGTNQYGYCQ